MGQIRKRYNTYFIRYYRNGRRYEESTHSSRKQDAVDLLRVREGNIAKESSPFLVETLRGS